MQWLPVTLLLGLVFLMLRWVGSPDGVIAGFGLVAAGLIYRALAPRLAPAKVEEAALATCWVGSLAMWVSAALSCVTFDVYYSMIAVLIAGAVCLTAWRVPGGIWKGRWNAAVMAWLLCAALIWLGAGYEWNRAATFFGGLLATLAALALCRCWFRWGALGAQVLNSALLLLAALPLVDLALRPQSRVAIRPETCRLYYSYDAAKGDPEAFGRWEEYYQEHFDRLGTEVFMPAPNSPLPFRLRPGSRGTMVRCPVSINSLGFRGPEISAGKDGAYRIIALGESTTFGMTIQPGDSPWPEMLEQIIRQRLKTRRPVQVINAGVPAYSIYQNLSRLPGEILPLQPDMIISYHGANGFHLISGAVLPPLGKIPPVYRERPIKLVGDAEHRLRMLLFRRQALRKIASAPAAPGRPLDTSYAAAYRQLIECARTNRVRLALANFSMAVNHGSDPRVIDFYQGGGSRLSYPFIEANAVHSRVVSAVAAEHPEVCLIDTHPYLDGDHEKFIDLIHLTNEGRRQLAENIFAGIRETLKHDLSALPEGANGSGLK